jgi:hypothetical protein
MRQLFLILILALGLQSGVQVPVTAQTSDVRIKGASTGCFAGKRYHPGKVGIYLFDVSVAPEIPKLIHEMEGYASRSDSQSQQKFFDSYNKLLQLVRVSTALERIRSDQFGNFTLRNLSTGLSVIVVGISPMEDDPAFYAYRELAGLRKGDNAVTLDFARGEICK